MIDGYPTILDVLDIQHPKVREALIERDCVEKVILFNYCGHGFLDLAAYDDFNHGRLIDA